MNPLKTIFMTQFSKLGRLKPRTQRIPGAIKFGRINYWLTTVANYCCSAVR